MKQLTSQHIIYRLVSPIFIGIIVYVLLLLLNNDLDQVRNSFLGEELYVCIILVYLNQELLRMCLLKYLKYHSKKGIYYCFIVGIVLALVLSTIIISALIYVYYKVFLEFAPSFGEIVAFNTIFCCFALIYGLVFIAQYFIDSYYQRGLELEIQDKLAADEALKDFVKEINPDLLFECFEEIVILMHKNELNTADHIIDLLAINYRYLLQNKRQELVPIKEELVALNRFIELINTLPYRAVKLKTDLSTDFLCVPSSLVKMMNTIIRNSIVTNKVELTLHLYEANDYIGIQYNPIDRINQAIKIEDFAHLNYVYEMYSARVISMETKAEYREIKIPKIVLEIDESNYHRR
ncbi:histidine kinase [Winogradskyella sp.]|uniref:histidine kinase n=1 Tax=Winogradskyella sp. TaxID=1883156 RepID=UPI00260CCDEF|nr:histidine kinase [Winogradskyella sp.]